MRVLLTIPHYFSPTAEDRRHGATADSASFRRSALQNCILSLHQSLGRPQCVMQIRDRKTDTANSSLTSLLHIVLCTVGRQHLLQDIPVESSLWQHHQVDGDPTQLGFEARNVLRDRWGSYDWYGYLEDDLLLHDPWFLQKLDWFISQTGEEAVLLPNRFERGNGTLATKAYVDGDLAEHLTADFQNIKDVPVVSGTALGHQVRFRRPLNPHSGCYFLSAAQMDFWMKQPKFSSRDTSFIGPLESAATLSLMRCFRIYKPDRSVASFLEIEHAGSRFISQLRRPESTDHT
ncbi:MAG: hypothetical protein Fues2KO_29370 [Fuerstiella sp.]